jgi:hypothetical protein
MTCLEFLELTPIAEPFTSSQRPLSEVLLG